MKRRSTALTVFALAGAVALTSGCTQSTESSAVGVQAILFIQRQTLVTTTNSDGTTTQKFDVDSGNTQVLDYTRYEPGGSLNLLSPARSDGTKTSLTSAFTTADFNGADVSFDGTQAVFSMKTSPTDNYHIYTVELSPGADGKFEMHQKTNGAWNDVSPIYVPGGLIAFVTDQMYTAMGTRDDEYEHARGSLQLATISVDGGDADRHLFTQNLSDSVAPFLRYDGKIGFSQWEHFGPVNDVKLRAVNPDGTQEVAVGGQHDNGGNETKPSNALFTARELSPNVMIGIGTARDRTIHAGALIQIDSRNQSDAVCLDANAYTNGGTVGHACLDEEHTAYSVLTPDVPLTADPSATSVGRYREPSLLPDGRILVSWADGAVNDQNELSLTPPDFGIYLFDPSTGKNELVYNERTTWELNALPVMARTEPQVIPSAQHVQDSTIAAHFGSVDISETSLNETVDGAEFANVPLGQALREGAVAVRVIEGFSTEATPGVSMFGLTLFEGAAVLGEAPVFNDGSWLADVPPYLPIHLQPIDEYGLAIRNQQLWIKGMPGETRRCIGCHESRTDPGVLALGQNPTVAEQQGAQPFTEAIADRTEFPWDKKVQPILDAKCVSCHNSTTTTYYDLTQTDPVTGLSTTYQIPTLDLSSTPVTVYYDESVATWPASYVSIFYPATIQMTGDSTGQSTITGTVPPMWGVPGSARASVLTQTLNLRAPDGTTAWPISTHPLHPEDQGVQLTDAERKTIAVYPMDLGGQFYSRQNTNFVSFTTGDPVTPAQ
ncbi:MAG: hypothetical protein ABSF69_00055 [Polyangiaceae bacterium]|jgi:hypothetical protein